MESFGLKPDLKQFKTYLDLSPMLQKLRPGGYTINPTPDGLYRYSTDVSICDVNAAIYCVDLADHFKDRIHNLRFWQIEEIKEELEDDEEAVEYEPLHGNCLEIPGPLFPQDELPEPAGYAQPLEDPVQAEEAHINMLLEPLDEDEEEVLEEGAYEDEDIGAVSDSDDAASEGDSSERSDGSDGEGPYTSDEEDWEQQPEYEDPPMDEDSEDGLSQYDPRNDVLDGEVAWNQLDSEEDNTDGIVFSNASFVF